MSRISVRLLAFNLLVVFVPIVAFLSLGTYERQLLRSQEVALVQQARLLAAALEDSGAGMAVEAERVVTALRQRSDARLRVVEADGRLLVDSARFGPRAEEATDRGAGEDRSAREASASAEDTFLYRLGSFPVRLWRRWVSPPRPPLETDDFYAGAAELRGPEVLDALDGRYGAATRISTSGQRSVTLYSAIPVFGAGRVAGAVLASQSTYRILVDLYDLRLDVFILFLGSVAAAAALSLLAAATITVPIRRLRDQAQRVLDARGRMSGRFEPSKRRDEVGDLSRSLGDLSRDLERRVGLLESFASDVSHELRNPLASIRSAVELALSVEEPPERSRLLESAIEDTRRMERLISGVREVSLLDSGVESEAEETVDVLEAAERVAEAARLARRPGAPVRFSAEGDRAAVRMPPGRLAQVIGNLVENAADFSPPGALVAVRVERGDAAAPAPEVVLSVTDEGPGIPADVIGRIFDRFFSFRPGEEAKSHSGLGLAIVKAIVEGRGGSVGAANLPGRGARFDVRLPMSRDA
ncbi:MAG: ATP-binding protein [Spirochaetes bacterium]|nr:ATP-binding protein [Spirochaetota bacterium]